MQIPVGSSFALVDDENFQWLSAVRWRISASGYVERYMWHSGKRAKVIMHRLVAMTPHDLITDHINGNKLDNRVANLRWCTQSENKMNRSLYKKNKTGCAGVGWHKETRKWRAYIRSNNKQIELGLFDDFAKAVIVRNEAAIKYHGQFARLYYPELEQQT
jgi:hypothetical protein